MQTYTTPRDLGPARADLTRRPGDQSGRDVAHRAGEYGADIVSYDRDFGRFPGVVHRLPA
jgi:hypothetical protein